MIIGRFRHVIRNILIQQLLTNTEDQESTASIKTEEGKTSFQGGAGQEVIMNLKWQYLMLVKILFSFLFDAGQDATRISYFHKIRRNKICFRL